MSNNIGHKELLDAGVHFGHLARKWDPRMAPYIFMERNGIHIIDLNKTIECLKEATTSIKNVARTGRKILFVATKKQAKGAIQEEAKRLRMPYVTERWLGGMLTNFATIRKSIKKMTALDRMMKEDTYKNFTKKERLMKTRKKEKIERVLGGISELNRLPTALFVVDVKKEFIAVNEATKLNIPVYGMVDTNSNPEQIQFAIPSNDDASKAIAVITSIFGKAIEEGLEERKKIREEEHKSREGQTEGSDDTGESQPDDLSSAASRKDQEAIKVQTDNEGSEVKQSRVFGTGTHDPAFKKEKNSPSHPGDKTLVQAGGEVEKKAVKNETPGKEKPKRIRKPVSAGSTQATSDSKGTKTIKKKAKKEAGKNEKAKKEPVKV
ncbi:MAG: 30S ribosomal protein S2 [Cytophagales bacterium]|nr:30S ribosomal protein S2 [Cytophagales bacterium]